METYRVELTLTLHRKVESWGKEDRIYLSAFVQTLREMSVDPVLAASNCIVGDVKYCAAGMIEELDFWMKLRMDWNRFVIRQPSENVLILSDR